MSDKDKIFEGLVTKFEKGLRRLELALLMQNLMVKQLDGSLEVEEVTTGLYLNALKGSKKSYTAFVKHVQEKYIRTE